MHGRQRLTSRINPHGARRGVDSSFQEKRAVHLKWIAPIILGIPALPLLQPACMATKRVAAYLSSWFPDHVKVLDPSRNALVPHGDRRQRLHRWSNCGERNRKMERAELKTLTLAVLKRENFSKPAMIISPMNCFDTFNQIL